MTIPTNGLVLDINPALMAAPDGPLAPLVAGGISWSGSGAALEVDVNGFRRLRIPGTFTSPPAVGRSNTTFIYLLQSIEGDAYGGTIGMHSPTLTISMTASALDTWKASGSSTTLVNPVGSPYTVGASVAADYDDIVLYSQGVAKTAYKGSPYIPAEGPGFLAGGRVYRALWYDRVLPPAEVAAIHAELLASVTPVRTITWDAPAATSSPIDAYVVQMSGPTGTTRLELEPTTRTVEAPAGATVLISARSALGTSTPVQLVVA